LIEYGQQAPVYPHRRQIFSTVRTSQYRER
jgi:hypothetical protein